MYEANATLTRPGSRLRQFFQDNGAILVILLAIAALLLGQRFGWFGGASALVGKPAPPLALASASGGRADLAAHQGKEVVLLDFFATWCPPCREGLPHLDALAKEYAGKGVTVYAVNVGETAALVNDYFRQNGIRLTALLDESGEVSSAYGVSGIPQQVLIAKDGTVDTVTVGAGNEAYLHKRIDALLAMP